MINIAEARYLARVHHQEAEMTHPVIDIAFVEQVDTYKIRIGFSDGKIQVVDFGPFLMHAKHPDIRAYLDEARFASFQLSYGELVWGDYDLCFPMLDLYNNELENNGELKAVA